MTDMVNQPPHYRKHPSGVECIEITEHMNFNLGNVIKYVWRADEKGCATEDLEKAAWYLRREIERRHEENPAVYCIRCGMPHPVDWQCKRDLKYSIHVGDGDPIPMSDFTIGGKVGPPMKDDIVGVKLTGGTLIQDRWRAMQDEHIQASARLAETIAEVCAVIDQLIWGNES